MDRLKLFCGKPILFNNTPIHSPTISEISEAGEENYSIFLILSTFDSKRIIKMFVTQEEFELEDDFDDYSYLTTLNNGELTSLISTAMSFFLKKEVNYMKSENSFHTEDGFFLSNKNYKEFVGLIKVLNCIGEQKEEKPKFKSRMAEKFYKQIKNFESKNKTSNNSLELKDILSILCYSGENGINIFNVDNLTVYQVYEQWERLTLKEGHNRLHPVYANGLLDDPKKLKEWMVRTKL